MVNRPPPAQRPFPTPGGGKNGSIAREKVQVPSSAIARAGVWGVWAFGASILKGTCTPL
jgi:hypothetical protein